MRHRVRHLPLRLRLHCGLLALRGALFATSCWTRAWPRAAPAPSIKLVSTLGTLGALMVALTVRERLAWERWQAQRRRASTKAAKQE